MFNFKMTPALQMTSDCNDFLARIYIYTRFTKITQYQTDIITF